MNMNFVFRPPLHVNHSLIGKMKRNVKYLVTEKVNSYTTIKIGLNVIFRLNFLSTSRRNRKNDDKTVL